MFDAKETIEKIVNDIRNYFDKYCPGGSAILGISGGKDSTITAALLVRALGTDRVYGVMLPCGTQRDISDSERVFEALGMEKHVLNIKDAFDATVKGLEDMGLTVSDDAKVNTQPRLRMTDLYAIAPCLPNKGLVVNTSNWSEDYVGYCTKYGDNTGDLGVLAAFVLSEVLAIGDAMPEIPTDLVHKAPSDGLWGDTDEDRFGFTYADIERYIREGTSGNTDTDIKIARMHRISRHKFEPMYCCGTGRTA